jgi:hypothetical protein
MAYVEFFFKGLSKTIEEFIVKMIEKGQGAVPAAVGSEERTLVMEEATDEEQEIRKIFQRKGPRKRVFQRRELGDLETRIFDVLMQNPEGCTLKDLAKALEMQWHFLRIPLRQLSMDGKVEKDGKLYKASIRKEAPPPVPAVVERDGVRRRFVDAKILDTPTEEKSEIERPEMSAREKEILRFKILTAFRGRPEGLTIVELAAVLGRSMEGLDYIVNELLSENKVIEGRGGKYHLA